MPTAEEVAARLQELRGSLFQWRFHPGLFGEEETPAAIAERLRRSMPPLPRLPGEEPGTSPFEVLRWLPPRSPGGVGTMEQLLPLPLRPLGRLLGQLFSSAGEIFGGGRSLLWDTLIPALGPETGVFSSLTVPVGGWLPLLPLPLGLLGLLALLLRSGVTLPGTLAASSLSLLAQGNSAPEAPASGGRRAPLSPGQLRPGR